MKKPKIYVWVYGSLRMGMGRNYYLQNGNFLGMLKIPGRMYKIEGQGEWFPTVEVKEDIQNNPPHSKVNVVGEIYQIDSKILQKLDKIEGHPMVYKRFFWNGIWIYRYYTEVWGEGDLTQENLIPGGDWVEWSKENV